MRESTYVVRELEVSAPGIHRLNGDLHCGCSLLLFVKERQTKKCLQQLHEEKPNSRKGDPGLSWPGGRARRHLGARDIQWTRTVRTTILRMLNIANIVRARMRIRNRSRVIFTYVPRVHNAPDTPFLDLTRVQRHFS